MRCHVRCLNPYTVGTVASRMNSDLSVPLGGLALPTPCFFPSVSTVKTNLPVAVYLDVLVNAGEPQFLVSAYDLAHAGNEREKVVSLLERARTRGAVVLLDSGNYEAYWKADAAWSPKALAQVLRDAPYDVAFCFDNQNPPSTADEIAKGVEESVLRDAASTTTTILPIVHASPRSLVAAVREVAARLYPIMLAVPERELGEGLIARAVNVRRLRNAMDASGMPCALHLLGTGNPLSLLVFSLAGADSFDGLEWCQTAVDPDTARAHHFQQRDLFETQLAPDAARELDYARQTLLHNLVFYRKWMQELQAARAAGTLAEMARAHLPVEFTRRLLAALEAV